MSQSKLGEAVGLTFQQVQKYERGSNRVGASRLFEISQVLGMPVSYFFDGLVHDIEDEETDSLGEEGSQFEQDLIQRRETLELVRVYYRINNPALRKNLYELARSIAETEMQQADTTPPQ